MSKPTVLFERKDLTRIVEAGFTSVSKSNISDIRTLTSLTAESVLGLSNYPAGSAQTYAFAFGYLLGVLNKVAILYAKESMK